MNYLSSLLVLQESDGSLCHLKDTNDYRTIGDSRTYNFDAYKNGARIITVTSPSGIITIYSNIVDFPPLFNDPDIPDPDDWILIPSINDTNNGGYVLTVPTPEEGEWSFRLTVLPLLPETEDGLVQTSGRNDVLIAYNKSSEFYDFLVAAVSAPVYESSGNSDYNVHMLEIDEYWSFVTRRQNVSTTSDVEFYYEEPYSNFEISLDIVPTCPDSLFIDNQSTFDGTGMVHNGDAFSSSNSSRISVADINGDNVFSQAPALGEYTLTGLSEGIYFINVVMVPSASGTKYYNEGDTVQINGIYKRCLVEGTYTFLQLSSPSLDWEVIEESELTERYKRTFVAVLRCSEESCYNGSFSYMFDANCKKNVLTSDEAIKHIKLALISMDIDFDETEQSKTEERFKSKFNEATYILGMICNCSYTPVGSQSSYQPSPGGGGGNGGSGSPATWGSISGSISNQTDLIALLASKEDSSNKSTSVVAYQSSDSKYPSVKAVFDWANSVFATASSVASQISSALAGYATQSWVAAQGYLTSSSLTGYATQAWVAAQGYLTSSSLTGYATQAWVAAQSYVTSSALTTALSSKQDSLNGTGFVRQDGSVTTYDTLSRSRVFYQNCIDATNTGSTSENIIDIITFPAGTLATHDALEVYLRFTKNTVLANTTVRFYTNTVTSLSGAVLLTTFVFAAANRFVGIKRTVVCKGSGLIEVFPSSITNAATDVVANSTAETTTTINYLGGNYIIVTAQLGNSSDVLRRSFVQVQHLRQAS